MLPITHPTTLRPVTIARLLEQQGSPLAALAEEIFDLAIAYRIDAAFALAQWMVESQFGCLPLAQTHCNAAMVRLAQTRLAPPTGPKHPVDDVQPILPLRYGDAFGSGYISYPSWLAGLEEYFRLLRLVFVDARHEEQVEQIAQSFLATMPGRKPALAAPPARTSGSAKQRQLSPPTGHQALVSAQEIAAYAWRIERYRAAFQAGMLIGAPTSQAFGD